MTEAPDRWSDDVFLAYAQWQLDVDQGRLIVLDAVWDLEDELGREPTLAEVTTAVAGVRGERLRKANTYLRALRLSTTREGHQQQSPANGAP